MFDPHQVEVFRFTSCCFDEETGSALFGYAFDDDVHFSESYVFPVPDEPLDAPTRAAVERGLFLLSLMAGISYYKAAVPPVARIETGPVTQDELGFLEKMYFEGLGEFSFVNQLSLAGRLRFEATTRTSGQPPALRLPRRSLVAVGGGKDSVVSIETLRAAEEPMVLASVNRAPAIVACIQAAGLDAVSTTRTLSSTLMDLNAKGALNGHVPITAVVSLTLAITALITGCDAVIMSNERSASSGNRQWDGREINHQYSKSLEAEEALAGLIRQSIAPNLAYFSLLRPLSELDIAARFARSDRYDSAFTSCNRAFRIDHKRRIDHWCGECDKCRFVFLALAPHMTPKRLGKIFGKDLLADNTQIPGFEALCGWQADKPFECVGEVEESLAAVVLLSQQPQWRDHSVVQHFVDKVLPQMDLPADLVTAPFVPANAHCLTPRYLEMLNLHAPS